VEKHTFSGFLIVNKLNEKKFFFKEEEFLEEINQLLFLMNSYLRLEPHIITQGLCLKLNSSLLKALDFKENELNTQISNILEKFF